MTPPRVAIFGIHLEANAFSPVTIQDDFSVLRGERLLQEAAKPHPRICAEIPAFISEMNRLIDWVPVPIMIAQAFPNGPAEHAYFEEALAEICSALTREGPLDAIFVSNHGAMTTTDDEDPDGTLLAAVRQIVGPRVPIIVTLDLHANISAAMFRHSDLIIGYRTNPHVDQADVARLGANHLVQSLNGRTWGRAMVQLPIFSPSTRLLTGTDQAFGRIMKRATAVGDEMCCSVFGGFAYSDVGEGGLSILAYGHNQDACSSFCRELADETWTHRDDFRVLLTPLHEAIARASAASRGAPVCLADVADNPGGGASGNTSSLLKALLDAETRGVLAGLFVVPELAEICHSTGVGSDVRIRIGATLQATGKQSTETDCIERAGRIIALSDGRMVGRRGIFKGRQVHLGLTAAIELDRITLVVVSERMQCCDPIFLEHLNLDIGQFPVVVVKSRGHFRAGFDEYFASPQIVEVDAPGLTSPVLSRFPFKRMRRPSYPLDGEFSLPSLQVLEG